MAFKLVVLAAALAVANAGLIGAPVAYSSPVAYASPAIGSSHESTVRSLDGNSAVTTYSKAVDTAFSSVRKYDSRASNDAQILAHAPVAAYAAAPAYTSYAAPAAYAAHSYAAPVAHAYAPAAYAAPIAKAYAAPAYAAAPVAHAGLLGVAYSAAPVVSHMTYTSGPIAYAY
ncbi:cuticle protein LPCP-23-like [Frankliniella occidentalis]|uniref:Cuticle protein LPCP-23-like n=1 Tax=Frankliniella occidentalis TaxID=133901 RepID=A0A6J1T5W8_FRAOC|nr:cuticle protein LPCP-23-like [Frankliniella occidentalis]